MPYCTKCGVEVEEKMAFCSKCGAPLKVEKPSTEAALAPTSRAEKAEKSEKSEKREKREKEEKAEKTEKYEAREVGVIGPLVGGLILIFLGCMFFLSVAGYLRWQDVGSYLLVILGIIIIVGVLYGAMTASKRHPRT